MRSFHSRGRKKEIAIVYIGCLGKVEFGGHTIFDQKSTTSGEGYMNESMVVVEKAVSQLTKIEPFSSHAVAQSSLDFQVKSLQVNRLIRWNEFLLLKNT